jgi:hypothetical protein
MIFIGAEFPPVEGKIEAATTAFISCDNADTALCNGNEIKLGVAEEFEGSSAPPGALTASFAFEAEVPNLFPFRNRFRDGEIVGIDSLVGIEVDLIALLEVER